MSDTHISDDELIERLERTMRAVATAAPEMSVSNTGGRSRWPVTAAAAVLVVAGVAGIAVLTNRQSGEPASANVPGAAEAGPGDGPPVAPTPWPATMPASEWTGELPAGVPYPEDFSMVTPMTWDMVQVGWELADQGEPTNRVQRCVDYAATFGSGWTSTPDTDEASSVLYARHFVDGESDVGVYCTADGMFLVQVIEAAALAALDTEILLLAPGIGLVESGASTPASSATASQMMQVLSDRGLAVELREHATRHLAGFDLEWAYFLDGDRRLFVAAGPTGLLDSFPVLVAELTPVDGGFEWPDQPGASTVALANAERTLIVRSESIEVGQPVRGRDELWDIARAITESLTID